MVWPFKWNLFSSSFQRYYLYLSFVLQNEFEICLEFSFWAVTKCACKSEVIVNRFVLLTAPSCCYGDIVLPAAWNWQHILRSLDRKTPRLQLKGCNPPSIFSQSVFGPVDQPAKQWLFLRTSHLLRFRHPCTLLSVCFFQDAWRKNPPLCQWHSVL